MRVVDDHRERILAYLRANGPSRPSWVYRALGISNDTFQEHRRELERDGLVASNGATTNARRYFAVDTPVSKRT
jgi:DNA-binding Lrp family transcriptional regulator